VVHVLGFLLGFLFAFFSVGLSGAELGGVLKSGVCLSNLLGSLGKSGYEGEGGEDSGFGECGITGRECFQGSLLWGCHVIIIIIYK